MFSSKAQDTLVDNHGSWFTFGCKFVNELFGASPAKIEEIKKKAKEKYEREEVAFKVIGREFKEIEYKYASADPRYKKLEKKFKKAEKRFEKIDRVYKQEKFKKAVYFTGLNVELHEVILFASFCAFISLASALMLDVVLFFGVKVDFFIILIYMIPLTFILPFVVFGFLTSYPDILVNRIEVLSLGRTPEAINYLVMSMRLSPSLNKAIAFAAENADEPLASGLKNVLWDVYMRKYNGIEESFLAFAYDWGDWNEDLKRSLYAIRSSTLEHTDEGLNRSLDKAVDIILSGTKRRIEDFAASLSTPTTVLFALGILMPMVIGAMLPMLALNLSMSPQEIMGTIGETAKGTVESVNALAIVLMMDITFPMISLVYAYFILGKRPGTSTPPKVKSKLTDSQRRSILVVSMIIGIMLSSFGILQIVGLFGEWAGMLGALLILWGISFSIGFYCKTTSFGQKKHRDEIIKMEDEFPDAMFQLGSRIAEGAPLEIALKKTGKAMEGTAIGKVFERIAYTLQITKSTLDNALFGDVGVLRNIPSRTIKAAMKTVVEIVGKDPTTAGQTIVATSAYLKDMKKAEHDIRIQLSSTVEMMKSTGILFAPIIMGITSSLYVLLAKEFAEIPGTTKMIDPALFLLIIGIYLIAIVIVIMYFTSGIEHGDDRIALKANIGTALPIAVVIYTIATIVCQLGIIGV